MAEKRALIADRDRCRAEAERISEPPENRTTRDMSQFLNELIERKAFSWTRVLENLEKVMPPRVHLVSISPRTGRRQPARAEDDGGGRFARAGHRTGAAHGRIAALCANRHHAREPQPSRRPATPSSSRLRRIYIPEMPDARGPRRQDGNISGKVRIESQDRSETEGAEREQALMPDLRQTRKNLKIALAVMAAVDLLAGDLVFLSAGWLGGIAADGIEPAAGRTQH